MKNRRQLNATWTGVVSAGISAFGAAEAVTPTTGQPPPSVLMIVVDDLRDTTGFLENFSGIKTPNLDRLASMGLLFENAHCAAPACGPSRTAVFSGLCPSTSGVYENGQPWAQAWWNHRTLTQEFMARGYYTAGSGKNYHNQGAQPNWHDYEQFPYDQDYGIEGDPLGRPLDIPVEEMADYKRVSWLIERLKENPAGPVFLSAGIVKPHLPFNVPREYFDRFPIDEIRRPETLADDLDDLPPIGRQIALLHWELNGRIRHESVLKYGHWEKNIQAYLACVSFVDDQIGRLLAAWEASPHSKNGIVLLWGDHGWHLGEKEHWSKYTLWNVGTRVPFVLVAPGVATPGSRTGAAVNLVDIFPTLLSLTGLPPRGDLDGQDLTPLLRDPQLPWKKGSVTWHGEGNCSVHSGTWHAIYYRDGTRELYDLEADPNEFHNLAPQAAENPELKQMLDRLFSENISRSPAPAIPFNLNRKSEFEEPFGHSHVQKPDTGE